MALIRMLLVRWEPLFGLHLDDCACQVDLKRAQAERDRRARPKFLLLLRLVVTYSWRPGWSLPTPIPPRGTRRHWGAVFWVHRCPKSCEPSEQPQV